MNAQQDPQYTQYMYNTMSVNAGYTGQRETLSVLGLYRTQWVGIDGAPKTQTFSIHSPLPNKDLGLGLSVVNDNIGPSSETYVDANFSYTIYVSAFTKLSFGLKAGVHQLSTDWSKGSFKNSDVMYSEDISRMSPTIGSGLYLHADKWYVGLSVPNILKTDHYDDIKESIANERMHAFLIAGYVFDLSPNFKLKPAVLIKGVSGTPLSADVSLNTLSYDKLVLGASWRWDDSVSALAGFQISEGLYIGYAYDLTTSKLNKYNSGSHEIMLRFELKKAGRLISPRFF